MENNEIWDKIFDKFRNQKGTIDDLEIFLKRNYVAPVSLKAAKDLGFTLNKEGKVVTLNKLDEYREKLKNHDWFYEFSEDQNIYRAGKTNEELLLKEAKELGPEYLELYQIHYKRVLDAVTRR